MIRNFANFVLLVNLIFVCGGSIAYVLSLEAFHDVDMLHQKLAYLSYLMLFSILCFMAAFCITLFSNKLDTRLKWISLLSIGGFILVLFSLDRGTTLTHHGAYNMLSFCMLAVPGMISILFTYWVLKYFTRRFFTCLGILVLMLNVI